MEHFYHYRKFFCTTLQGLATYGQIQPQLVFINTSFIGTELTANGLQAVFTLQQQSGEVTTEPIQPTKPKIFINQPFRQKVCQSLLQGRRRHSSSTKRKKKMGKNKEQIIYQNASRNRISQWSLALKTDRPTKRSGELTIQIEQIGKEQKDHNSALPPSYQ